MVFCYPRFGFPLMGLILLTGCSSRPAALAPPALDPSAAAKEALGQYDTNKDGAIEGAELDKAPALKAALARIDKNNDHRITADELTLRMQSWRDSKTALTSFVCRVTLDGKPLNEATVTLVPEKFLGSAILKASGITNAEGLAVLSATGAEGGKHTAGVHLGFYKVEISPKAGAKEVVPSKYNTETTLGVEVAPDSPDVQKTVLFELKSK